MLCQQGSMHRTEDIAATALLLNLFAILGDKSFWLLADGTSTGHCMFQCTGSNLARAKNSNFSDRCLPQSWFFCYIRYQIYIDLFTSSCTFEINCNSHFKKMGTTVHLQEGFWACACVLVQPPFVALSPVYDAAYKLFVTIFQTFHTFSCQKRRAYLYEKWWF